MKIVSFLKYFNVVLIGLFAVGMGIFFIIMPKYGDDCRFLEFTYNWFIEQGVLDFNGGGNIFKYGIPWQEIFQTIETNYYGDNIRLGNIFDIFFLLFPKWFSSGIMAFLWIEVMLLSFKIARINIGRSPLVILALALWMFSIPWEDMFGSIVHQFNYIPPTFFALLLIYATPIPTVSKADEVKLNSLSKKIFVGMISFTIGWWHEAFSVPLAASIFLMMVCFKDERVKVNYIALIGLILGILIIALAPGTGKRFELQVSYSNIVMIEKFTRVLINNIPFYIFLFLCICRGWLQGLKAVFRDRVLIFFLFNGVFNILLSLLTYTAPRVTWWTQIISIIGIMWILRNNKSFRRYAPGNLLWGIPLILIVFVHLVMVDVVVIRFHQTFIKTVKEYINNPNKTLFTKAYTLRDLPLINFYMPNAKMYDYFYTMDYTRLFSKVYNKPFVPVPEELRNVTVDSGNPAEGIEGLREYKGRYYISADSIDSPPFSISLLSVDYGKGYVNVMGTSSRFISEGDGKEYIYVRDMPPWYVSHFKKIHGFKVIYIDTDKVKDN